MYSLGSGPFDSTFSFSLNLAGKDCERLEENIPMVWKTCCGDVVRVV